MGEEYEHLNFWKESEPVYIFVPWTNEDLKTYGIIKPEPTLEIEFKIY